MRVATTHNKPRNKRNTVILQLIKLKYEKHLSSGPFHNAGLYSSFLRFNFTHLCMQIWDLYWFLTFPGSHCRNPRASEDSWKREWNQWGASISTTCTNPWRGIRRQFPRTGSACARGRHAAHICRTQLSTGMLDAPLFSLVFNRKGQKLDWLLDPISEQEALLYLKYGAHLPALHRSVRSSYLFSLRHTYVSL